MSVVERKITIVNRYGLHARPAMRFVEVANSYACNVEVSNGSLTVDAKSIMSVMRLAATAGTILTLTASGTDAEQAIQEIEKLITDGFGEMDGEPAEAEAVG